MKELLRELEEAVVDAWPAAETEELDGWLLRKSGGPTHRGNSVATLAARGALDLDSRIERAEAWYRQRGLPALFQIGPCAAPAALEAALIARGYRKEGSAVCCVAAPESVLACRAGLESSVHARPSADWWQLAAHASRFAATPRVLDGFLARLGSRCRFALVCGAGGEPLSAALGIASEDRLGVYAMITLPEARRRGAARAVLHALAESARRDQMRALYLLVDLENAPARALYAGSGFADVYRYHYRVQASAAS